MYTPARDVRMWLKVSVLFVLSWIPNWSPMLVSTVLLPWGNSHTKVGLSIRYSSKAAVQVMVPWLPASTDIPWTGETETVGAGRAAELKKWTLTIQQMYQL